MIEIRSQAKGGGEQMTHTGQRGRRRHVGRRNWWRHAVALPVTLFWVAPIAFVILTSIRSQDDMANNGMDLLPRSFSISSFKTAITQGLVGTGLVNSGIIVISSVIVALFLASLAAFGLSRFHIPFSRTILLAMLAANLLPPQILLVPFWQYAQRLHIYDTRFVVIVVEVCFGLGFYTFFLYSFMAGIPTEIIEAAQLAGASSARIYASVMIPLCRPALAALAALAVTFVYNNLIFPLSLMQSTSKFPVTTTLLNLQGSFSSFWNVVAAGALIAALPTAIIFFAFQRSFTVGLAVK